MNDEEYLATQEQLMLLGRLVLALDLDEFLRRIDRAEAFGPIVDPTMYRAASKNLQDIKTVARAANAFRRELVQLQGKLHEEMALASETVQEARQRLESAQPGMDTEKP